MVEKQGVVTSIPPVETLMTGIKLSNQEVDDQAPRGLLWVTIKNQGLYKSEIKQSRQYFNAQTSLSWLKAYKHYPLRKEAKWTMNWKHYV